MSKTFIKHFYCTQTTGRLVLHSTNGHYYSILLPKCKKYSSQKTKSILHWMTPYKRNILTNDIIKNTKQKPPSNRNPATTNSETNTATSHWRCFLLCLVWWMRGQHDHQPPTTATPTSGLRTSTRCWWLILRRWSAPGPADSGAKYRGLYIDQCEVMIGVLFVVF